MHTQSWSVDVNGIEHEIRVDTDEAGGKSFIRVDGRMATQPLAPTERQRKIIVAGAGYIIRKAKQGFEVDIAPPEVNWNDPTLPPTRAAVAAEKKASKPVSYTRIFVMVGIVALAGVAAGFLRTARQYGKVAWKPYTGPSEKFRVSFPGDPKVQSAGYGPVSATLLSATYLEHEYDLFYYDLPFNTPDNAADALLDKMLAGVATKESGTIIEKTPHWYARHAALKFVMNIPANVEHASSTMNGRLILCKHSRVYGIFVVTPARQSFSADVAQFLSSLELPADDAPSSGDAPRQAFQPWHGNSIGDQERRQQAEEQRRYQQPQYPQPYPQSYPQQPRRNVYSTPQPEGGPPPVYQPPPPSLPPPL